MDGRYGRRELAIEGVIDECDNFESVREKGRMITRFLLTGDDRTYYFYSENKDVCRGVKVKIYLNSFDKDRAVVKKIDFLDKNHRAEVSR